MEATFLLGLTCLCSPLTALVLDFNTIRGSSEVSGSKKSTQCLADKDCRVGKYCYKPQEEQLPFCAPCQGLRRRCQGNGMCCPGTICINEVCAQVERMPLAEEQRDGRQADLGAKERRPRPAQAGHVRKEGARPRARSPAGTGERCLRTSECAQGHCCARHFWAKICKPVLLEGAVCSGRGQKDGGRQAPKSSSVAVAHPAWFVNGPSGAPHRELACVSAAATKEVLSLEGGQKQREPKGKQSAQGSVPKGLAGCAPGFTDMAPLRTLLVTELQPYLSWQKIT